MGRKKVELQRCPFSHEDCFALVPSKHTCNALQDTSFETGRDCPFYKNLSEIEPEYVVRNKIGERKK